MPADRQTVAQIASILHKHFDGDEPGHSKRIKLAAAEIGRALLRSKAVVHGRIARIGSANRSGELPDRVFALMMDGKSRTVTEILAAVESEDVTRKQVYNCLGYLVRFDKIERVGHARYQVLSPIPEARSHDLPARSRTPS